MNELIENRRSIRKFEPDYRITKEQLNKLLGAAMMAPSARNRRPWEFIAVTKRETLDELVRIHPYAAMCGTASAAIIVLGIPQADSKADFVPQDCGAATENILIEAVSLGLGTCWCGVYPKKDLMEKLSGYFGIQEPKYPFNLIAVGKPAENPKAKGFFEEGKVRYIE